MIYKVKARIIENQLSELYRKLTDGTIAQQKPDGNEIIASMKRAVLTKSGIAEWYQMCLCSSPLLHERKTQYDLYFTDITTEEAEDYGEIEGDSFWSYMASIAEES